MGQSEDGLVAPVVADPRSGLPAFGPVRSERFVVAVSDGAVFRSLFQIHFAKKDGSIFVDFPFYADSHGIGSVVVFPAGPPSRDVRLTDQGKVTSHLVKYAHHPNGRAHFSQDSKIITVIKKHSVPLDSAAGHLFSVYVRGLDRFSLDDGATATRRKAVMKFTVPAQPMKFVAMTYALEEMRRRSQGVIMPWGKTVDDSGKSREAFVCGPPAGRPGQFQLVVVGCEPIPDLKGDAESVLIFLGGFDRREIAFDHSRDTSFLALMYPCSDYEELRKTIGSMDFVASTRQDGE